MSDETATPNPNTTSCCICYLTDTTNETNNFWTCSTCGTKCHMNCILQWALTNIVHRTSFTCPMCRHMFSLNTLTNRDSNRRDDIFSRPTQSLMFFSEPSLLSARRYTSILGTISSLLHDVPRQDTYLRNVNNTPQEDNVEDENQVDPQEEVMTNMSEPRRISNRSRQNPSSIIMITDSGTIRINKLTVINK